MSSSSPASNSLDPLCFSSSVLKQNQHKHLIIVMLLKNIVGVDIRSNDTSWRSMQQQDICQFTFFSICSSLIPCFPNNTVTQGSICVVVLAFPGPGSRTLLCFISLDLLFYFEIFSLAFLYMTVFCHCMIMSITWNKLLKLNALANLKSNKPNSGDIFVVILQ